MLRKDYICNQKAQKEEEEKFSDKGCFKLWKFSSKVDYFAVLSNGLSICLTCIFYICTYRYILETRRLKLWWSEAEMEEEICEQSKCSNGTVAYCTYFSNMRYNWHTDFRRFNFLSKLVKLKKSAVCPKPLTAIDLRKQVAYEWE